MPSRPRKGGFTIDVMLVAMVVIWGVNYSVIKRAFQEIPPNPFNALRVAIASSVFLVAIQMAKRRARSSHRKISSVFYTPHELTSRDRLDLLWLGIVGHFFYQFCFVGGINGTSVSNAALIIGMTPVVVAVGSAILWGDRIAPLHWLGAVISVLGIYFVIGHAATFGGATLHGDELVMVSVTCWAAYTIGAQRLITRHSPLYVTGMTMVIGGVPYVLVTLPQLVRMPWGQVSAWTWIALVLSALLALNAAYLIWYTAVQRIGAARTAIVSNVVPLVAMTTAAIWLGEPLTSAKLAGAAAVLTGVFLTRLGRRPPAVPIEE